MKLSRRRAILLGVLAVAVPSGVLAATVKGKVVNTSELLNPVWNEAKDPGSHRYTFREPSPSVPADARILRGNLSKEVCIVALTEGKAEPLKKPIRVVVEGGRTSPVTLVVAEKQEILFENHDPWDHAIYEVTEKGGLTHGTMTPEKAGSESHKRTWTPPGPGVYEIRDEISPGLRSWVVVEPRAHRALFPNRKGDFDKLELDPGSYTLVAYYSGKQVGEPLPFEVKPAPAEQPLKDPLKAGPDKKAPEKKDEKDEKKTDQAKGGG